MSTPDPAGLQRNPPRRNPGARSEFLAVFAARVLSDWGDQLARVAIAALVLNRSGSALFAAAAFAVSWLPQAFGQALLGPVADRLPRRALLVGCDLLRAALVALLVAAVLARLPVGVLLLLLFIIELVGAPFFAAAQALLVDIFADETSRYLRASNVLTMSLQLDQVLGVALGAVVVAALGADRALWVDAATFAVSAVLLGVFVRARAAAAPGGVPGMAAMVRDAREGLAYLRDDVPLRSLAALACLLLPASVAPEAVALPLANEHGAGTRVGGLLLAAAPLGVVLGGAVLGRWTPMQQVQRLPVMAILLPLPLLAMAVDPPWPFAVGLFVLAGMCQALMLPLMGTYAVLAPEPMRGRLNGAAGAVYSLAGALSFMIMGALADATSPASAVALTAAATLLALVAARRRWPARELDEAAAATYH